MSPLISKYTGKLVRYVARELPVAMAVVVTQLSVQAPQGSHATIYEPEVMPPDPVPIQSAL